MKNKARRHKRDLDDWPDIDDGATAFANPTVCGAAMAPFRTIAEHAANSRDHWLGLLRDRVKH